MTMQNRLLIILALLFITDCQKDSPKPYAISPEEYIVYSKIIESLSDSGRVKSMLICDSTLKQYPIEPKEDDVGIVKYTEVYQYVPYDWKRIKYLWPEFNDTDFRKSLPRANHFSMKLFVDSISSTVPLKSLSQWPSSSPFIDKNVSVDFYRKIVWLSHVAFNNAQNEALVYVEYHCGSLCGAGNWFWLKKYQSHWKIHKHMETWVS
jgi:hypothetical protein